MSNNSEVVSMCMFHHLLEGVNKTKVVNRMNKSPLFEGVEKLMTM